MVAFRLLDLGVAEVAWLDRGDQAPAAGLCANSLMTGISSRAPVQRATSAAKATSSAWVTVMRYSDYAWRDVPDAWLQRDYLPRFKPE